MHGGGGRERPAKGLPGEWRCKQRWQATNLHFHLPLHPSHSSPFSPAGLCRVASASSLSSVPSLSWASQTPTPLTGTEQLGGQLSRQLRGQLSWLLRRQLRWLQVGAAGGSSRAFRAGRTATAGWHPPVLQWDNGGHSLHCGPRGWRLPSAAAGGTVERHCRVVLPNVHRVNFTVQSHSVDFAEHVLSTADSSTRIVRFLTKRTMC